jgi:PAS domain S-box-containing protein
MRFPDIGQKGRRRLAQHTMLERKGEDLMDGNLQSPVGHQMMILDSISEGVFTVDLDWRITSFNRAAERITGVPRHEAIGRYCYEVLRANVCDSGCVLRKTVKNQKAIRNKAVTIVRGDDKAVPISVSTALLKDEFGHVVGGVETFLDLTVVDELRKELQKKHSFGDIISKNEEMLRLFSILPQIAQSESSVLIQGASGTGKELFALAIHNNSRRNSGPFIAVNAGALPDTLCESELFGYKSGAFTDAKRDKPGRFALAENGTIFLDEIADISPAMQVRLLRVLEEKCFEPLGSTEKIQTNARVITATNRNLAKMVEEGRFRDDLYYRINVVKLSIPNLSERKQDIPLLVDHFIQRFNHLTGKEITGVSGETLGALMHHEWPGNVRELENAIEHAFVLCDEGLLQLRHLPTQLIPQKDLSAVRNAVSMKEIERQAIEEALRRNAWKKSKTARELGIDRNTLRRKIQRFGILEPA